MARLITGDFEEAQIAGPIAAEAYFQLGIKFSAGAGVEQDFVVAHKWFNLAAMQGNERAKCERAALSAEMSPHQISAAQRMAREWIATVH